MHDLVLIFKHFSWLELLMFFSYIRSSITITFSWYYIQLQFNYIHAGIFAIYLLSKIFWLIPLPWLHITSFHWLYLLLLVKVHLFNFFFITMLKLTEPFLLELTLYIIFLAFVFLPSLTLPSNLISCHLENNPTNIGAFLVHGISSPWEH